MTALKPTDVCNLDHLKITINENIFITPLNQAQNIHSQIIRDNRFHNPKFISNYQNGYSNHETPETIETFKHYQDGIMVPRGYLPNLLKLLEVNGEEIRVEDLRVTKPIEFPTLNVEFRPYQKNAVEQALKSDQGVIVSPTGSGKSLIGLEIIRQRAQKTLILVHRKDLADQWIEVIKDRMGLNAGLIGDGKWQIGIEITVAMVQTLASKEEDCQKIGESFGLLLCDETHHIPCNTFYSVIGKIGAKYLYGLSATVNRRDGLEAMIYRGIGNPIVNISKSEVESIGATVPVSIIAIKTGFAPSYATSWNEYLDEITNSTSRNTLIANLAENSTDPVLILCDRIAHAGLISEILSKKKIAHTLAHGQLKSAERSEAMEQMLTANITVGTTSLLGEGLDVKGWAILIMASPISSEIKLMQAIGRCVRPNKDKEQALIYDLKDDCGFAGSSFNKRFEIYKKNKIWVTFEK